MNMYEDSKVQIPKDYQVKIIRLILSLLNIQEVLTISCFYSRGLKHKVRVPHVARQMLLCGPRTS